MRTMYYIGLDIHKKMIAYCIKTVDGCIIGQGKIDANRRSVGEWVNGLPGPWIGAMEATQPRGRRVPEPGLDHLSTMG